MNIAAIFRATARPAVTIIFAATIAQVVTQGIDAPQWFLGLAIPVILWWFGERTVGHVKQKKEDIHPTSSLRGAEGDEAISKEKEEK